MGEELFVDIRVLELRADRRPRPRRGPSNIYRIIDEEEFLVRRLMFELIAIPLSEVYYEIDYFRSRPGDFMESVLIWATTKPFACTACLRSIINKAPRLATILSRFRTSL